MSARAVSPAGCHVRPRGRRGGGRCAGRALRPCAAREPRRAGEETERGGLQGVQGERGRTTALPQRQGVSTAFLRRRSCGFLSPGAAAEARAPRLVRFAVWRREGAAQGRRTKEGGRRGRGAAAAHNVRGTLCVCVWLMKNSACAPSTRQEEPSAAGVRRPGSVLRRRREERARQPRGTAAAAVAAVPPVAPDLTLARHGSAVDLI